MRVLYLVSCVAQKAPTARSARDLYTSAWFEKARRYVERQGAEWRILSAQYGLLDPMRIVEPYERTLNAMPVAERRQWARQVGDALDLLVTRGDTVVFLAGDRYREFLVDHLKARGIDVKIPMEGLQIGRQLQWLDRAVELR